MLSSYSTTVAQAPDELYERAELTSSLLGLDVLSARERQAIKLHFEDGLTLKAASDALGISPERTRQVIRDATDKMRRYLVMSDPAWRARAAAVAREDARRAKAERARNEEAAFIASTPTLCARRGAPRGCSMQIVMGFERARPMAWTWNPAKAEFQIVRPDEAMTGRRSIEPPLAMAEAKRLVRGVHRDSADFYKLTELVTNIRLLALRYVDFPSVRSPFQPMVMLAIEAVTIAVAFRTYLLARGWKPWREYIDLPEAGVQLQRALDAHRAASASFTCPLFVGGYCVVSR